MPTYPLSDFRTIELLEHFGEILAELRRRGITRSENLPTGGLAEFLVCRALRLEPAPNSTRGFDATDSLGKKYQIKGRRVTVDHKSRQLSAIRDIDAGHFDYLVAVFFDSRFGIYFAYRFTAQSCVRNAQFVAHTNSYRLFASEKLIQRPDTIDISNRLRAVLRKV